MSNALTYEPDPPFARRRHSRTAVASLVCAAVGPGMVIAELAWPKAPPWTVLGRSGELVLLVLALAWLASLLFAAASLVFSKQKRACAVIALIMLMCQPLFFWILLPMLS